MQIWNWRDQAGAFGCAVLVFTLLGPFETYGMPLALRMLYWLLCLASGWALMIAAMTLVLRHPSMDDWSGPLRVGLAVVIAVAPITLAVSAIEDWLRPGRDEVGLGWFLLNTMLVCGLIAGAMYFRVQDRLGRIDAKIGSPTPFFQRLPYELGNELISFTMRDHYVEVTTTKGKTLVLMSLGDALEELGDYAGTQIHRSHWVAASAYQRLEKSGGKLFVKLSDGRSLPVSRTYAASARALPSMQV